MGSDRVRATVRRTVRSTFERLPQSVREDVRRRRLEAQGIGQLKENQALLAKRLADLETARFGAPVPSDAVSDPRFPAGVTSRLCTQAEWSQPWFGQWCAAMDEPPVAHRKVWEFAYIAQMLAATGMLEEGRRGLGFGVGREPLVSLFAARGVEVLATDLGGEDRESIGWARSNQHASAVEDMLRPQVCDPEDFRKRVSWRAVDMRAIPDDLRGFDFCWSACSLEHLGTLDEGWRFVEQSLRTLRPGGIAVHTTEFNVGSDDDTVEQGSTVVYRERDVRALRDRLEAAGHEVAALDFSRGTGLLDQYVDVPPYKVEPVLRFRLGRYTLTSVALVVRAGGG